MLKSFHFSSALNVSESASQVRPRPVFGGAEPLARRPRAAPLLLVHDVRERRHQHAASARVLPEERPSAGAAAQHHDPHRPGAAPPG